MANVEGKFYRGETQRRGVTPVSPPNAEDDPQDPLNPPGAGNTTTYKQLGDTIDKSFVGKNGYVPVVTTENTLTLQPNIPNTGVAVFGGVVYNSTTTVDIGIVKGYIVDNETDPLVSSVLPIEYAGATGVTVTTVGSGTRSYALLKSDGTIHFQNTYPTSEDRKQMIYLFKVGHPAGVITVVANEPDFVLSPLQQFRDLFQAFNYVNEGVYPYADAADLTFNTSAGLIVGNGINFVPEPANPNILTVAATTPCTFVYRSQTGAGGGATTLIDPNIWDNAGTIDSVGGGSNRSTIQYIHYSPNLGFVIQPGQVIYDNLVDAIAAIGKEEHVVYENLIRDAILIGVLALTRSTTDLTDTDDARFFRADIFGQLVGSAAGTSVTTLQRAYLNSLIPQIETVSGELAIKNGGASDTDVVFAIRSLLDVDNIQMYGDGRIRHSDAVNSDESATLGQVIDLALGDGLISGGIVQWTGTGYNFDVSAALARFKDIYPLTSLADTLTLTTPDATNDRIDLFILQILFDVDGIPIGMEADFITGTPAANPVKPQINPETQIELTQVLVDAGSTTPTLTEEVIYDQNTEWTGTSSGTGTAVFNSAVDPYQGSVSVNTTNIQNGFYIQFNNGAEIDISTYQTIGFHIKLKASLGTNQNLYLTFLDGSLAPVSNFVLVNLDKYLLTYQFVGIALNAVNFTSSDVQYIRVSFVRTSGSTTFSGYFFDVFKLEGGITPPETNSEHNQLLGIQGGNATERYHLSAVEHQRVQDFSPYDLAQEGATNNQVLTWVSANSRYEPVTPSSGGITGSGTANQIAYFTGATAIGSLSTATYPSLTELSYVKGVTSSIQTQLNAAGSKWTDGTSGTIYRNSFVGIGNVSTPLFQLHIERNQSGTSFTDRSAILVKNSNSGGATSIFVENDLGKRAGLQFNGSAYFTGLNNKFNFVTYQDDRIEFLTNGATTTGGSAGIDFKLGGFDEGISFKFDINGDFRIINPRYSVLEASFILYNSSASFGLDRKLFIAAPSASSGSAYNGIVMSSNNQIETGGVDTIQFRSGGYGISQTMLTLTNSGLTISESKNISVGTTTGTKIGTATSQKIAFWNKTPIIQPTNAIAASAFVANTSGIANDTATFGGYTIGQIAAALINTGILA